jgi:hypothetical protein
MNKWSYDLKRKQDIFLVLYFSLPSTYINIQVILFNFYTNIVSLIFSHRSILQIDHVIIFDFPLNPVDYIHR